MKKCIAWVVGINHYDNYPTLKAAVNDATEIGKALEKLKYEVIYSLDEPKGTVDADKEKFEEMLHKGKYDVALFYFAGHGSMANKSDCLLMKETRYQSFDNEVFIRNSSILIDDLCKDFRSLGDQINIFIIDACRSEIDRSTSTNFDFGKCSTLRYQTFIAYSTSPGASAKDGIEHSPYTQSVLDHIYDENLPIEALFKIVRKEVYSSTGQLPWEHSCLIDTYCFNYGQNSPYFEAKYSQNAFEDRMYISDNNLAQDIISQFKMYDYNIQEKALLTFIKIHKQLSVDDKFVIGRNILQAAEGECFACQREFSSNALSVFQMENGNNAVLDGILYEMYFNSSNELRQSVRGFRFMGRLKTVLMNSAFESSALFIRNSLKPYLNKVNYIVGDKKVHSVSVRVIALEKETIDAEKSWQLVSIIYANNDLTDNFLTNSSGEKRKRNFVEDISYFLQIPMENLKITFSNDIQSNDLIICGSTRCPNGIDNLYF